MNERIQELFGKALDEAVPETWTVLNPEQLSRLKTKFAELIIRECAQVAYHYTDGSENYQHYNDIGWDCLPGHLFHHIREHFGVKE